MDLMSVLKRLYASEINASVSCQWDGGWDVKLGDEMNGFVAEASFHSSNATNPDTYEHAREWCSLEDAATWLDLKAREHYPESQYAKRLVCCYIVSFPTKAKPTDETAREMYDRGEALSEITGFVERHRCDATAEFVIYGRTGTPEDYTHACIRHVGELLGDAPGHPLSAMSYQVRPICGVCGNESPEVHPDPHCPGCSPWMLEEEALRRTGEAVT